MFSLTLVWFVSIFLHTKWLFFNVHSSFPSLTELVVLGKENRLWSKLTTFNVEVCHPRCAVSNDIESRWVYISQYLIYT
jgi:hypothetical protein